MKSHSAISNKVLILLSFFFLSQSISAQDCKGFFPFEPDTKIEMTQYDKKGKTTSVTQTTIVDITETDGQVEAEISATVLDKKGEELHTGDYNIACKENGYEIDVTNMMNPAVMKSTYGMEVEVSGDALVFPNDLNVGKELEDASAEIIVSSSGIKIMTMTFDLTNRKVILQESVTTAAGTFDCYKLEYDLNMKLGFVKKKYKVIQWIAEGVGVVKDETYNKKGKLDSSSELTKFEKP